MAHPFKIFAALAVAATLTACGESAIERGATGALIGGAAAAVTGESVRDGVLIGGAIGAVSCSVAPGAPNCY